MGLQKRVVILSLGLLLTTSSSVVAYEPQTASPQQPDTVEQQKAKGAVGAIVCMINDSALAFEVWTLLRNRNSKCRLFCSAT